VKSWYKIADNENDIPFKENNIAVVEINNKKICIGKHEQKLYAFAYKCPHASGIMANGNIDDKGTVICPTHRYRFNLKNGNNVSGEGYYLKHWNIEQRPNGIYVEMEKAGLFGFIT
jgi:nitrite reductase/ring-hydroxylating ferredoxin subunit